MKRPVPPLVAAVLLAGCASLPAGPGALVLPGDGKSIEQFQVDDAACRQWAGEQTGSWLQRRYDAEGSPDPGDPRPAPEILAQSGGHIADALHHPSAAGASPCATTRVSLTIH